MAELAEVPLRSPPPCGAGPRGAGLGMMRLCLQPSQPQQYSCVGEQLPPQASNYRGAEAPKSFSGHNVLPSALGSERLVLQSQAGLGHPCDVMFIGINCLAVSELEVRANSVVVTPNSLALGSDAAVASTMEILQIDRPKDARTQM